jgi:hypothetical protein
MEKSFPPSFPVCYAAHRPKSGCAPSVWPLVHLRTPSLLSPARSRPSAAQLRALPGAAADGRVLPVIPDLGSESYWGRDPDPEPALRAPLAAGPHAKVPPMAYKSPPPHRIAPFAQTLALSSYSTAANPSRATAVEPPVRRLSVAVKVARSFAAR